MLESRSTGKSGLVVAALMMCGTIQAQPAFDDHLSGDWGGTRTALLAHGVALDLFNTTDAFGSIRGGIADGVVFSNAFEAVLSADLMPLLGWPGARVYLHTIGSGGRAPVELSGSIHEPSGLADDDALRVLEFWIEQSFLQQRLSVLAGLFEVDSEFDARGTGDLFLSDGFGFGLELPNVGLEGVSFSPLSGLGLRARFQLSAQRP